MDVVLMTILGATLIILSFIGCLLPVLPGPLLAYGALWVLVCFGVAVEINTLVWGAVVVAAAMAVDYILPTVFAKKFKCSAWGVFGCMVGTVAGLFFLPLGIIAGPFLGTIAGEFIAGSSLRAALRGGVGTLFGFFTCLLIKLAAVVLFTYWFFKSLPL